MLDGQKHPRFQVTRRSQYESPYWDCLSHHAHGLAKMNVFYNYELGKSDR
jgi:hypothetical protein